MWPKVILGIFIYCVIVGISDTNAIENTTTKENTTQTTPKPKINITNSDLCKRCKCDIQYKQLDCSHLEMNEAFDEKQWNTLLNGDVTFEIIKLDHNNISTITGFPPYPVKDLYLGHNQIKSIGRAAFLNLTELTKLSLSHNKLTSKALTPQVFEGPYTAQQYEPLKNLRELDLCYNELHNLDADLFEHTPNLEALYLCSNIFKVIDHLTEVALAGLTSLKTLDLSYMELTDLPDNFLHGPRDLQTLILSGNLLKELPDNMDLGINLKELVLDENPMEDFIGENIFPKMQSLQYLSISYLPELTTIGIGAFKDLQNLTTLVASHNPKLSLIHHAAFARKTVNPLIYDYPPLEKLYLHHNNLTVLDVGMLERWDKIKTIDLRFNPWNCGKTNHWLIKILMVQINATTPALARNIECGAPAAWKKKPLLALMSEEITLPHDDNNKTYNRSILMGTLLGVIIGIPLAVCAMVIYRRGCFGYLNRRTTARGSAIYNRAKFDGDFHI